MKSFLSRFGALVLFVLSGFDRLRLAGESRLLNHSLGVQSYLWQRRIPFKDFPGHAEHLTQALRKDTEALAKEQGVPLRYLNSPDIDKEAVALELAGRHSRKQGRIALLTCVESCSTYRLRKNERGLIEPRKEPARCVHFTTTSSTNDSDSVTSESNPGFPSAFASASTAASGCIGNSNNTASISNARATCSSALLIRSKRKPCSTSKRAPTGPLSCNNSSSRFIPCGPIYTTPCELLTTG